MDNDLPTEHDQRRYWRLQWLSSIEAFANSEVQAARWLDTAERNPHYSFVECMCCYFDDANLGEEDAYSKRVALGRVSAEETGAVAEFHSLADAYQSPNGNDWDVEAILRDPKWMSVVDAAKEAQKNLAKLIGDEAELMALTRPLVWEETDGVFRAEVSASIITSPEKFEAIQGRSS